MLKVFGSGMKCGFLWGGCYSRFLAKALPEPVLRYCSNSRAFSRSVKEITQAVDLKFSLEILKNWLSYLPYNQRSPSRDTF